MVQQQVLEMLFDVGFSATLGQQLCLGFVSVAAGGCFAVAFIGHLDAESGAIMQAATRMAGMRKPVNIRIAVRSNGTVRRGIAVVTLRYHAGRSFRGAVIPVELLGMFGLRNV